MKVCKGHILGFVVFLVGLLCCDTVLADKPNIIFIMSDDQGIDAIEGPLDNTEHEIWPNSLNVHTPVLRTLATGGTVFRYARANSYCAPTRAGIMSGRYALQTGVTGIPIEHVSDPARDLMYLQGHETTIAEILKIAEYHTIHADKWHCGWTDEQIPLAQGFDVSFPRLDYLDLDLPEETGDEHISTMVDLAINAYQEAPAGPKALVFWTYFPHGRDIDRGGFGWWEVDTDLLPSGEDYYDVPVQDNRIRYRAMVEAMDTEIGRMLYQLGVINQNGNYRTESNTIVFFMSDNGTPRDISDRSNHAKGSLFEGGTRVPLFVFGAGVENDTIVNKLISHVDLFDTIADIAGVPYSERGELPREGKSFARDLGYAVPPSDRLYSISSQGSRDPLAHHVAITDGNYKLIAIAGSDGLVSIDNYRFYDLLENPAETINLLAEDAPQMTTPQRIAVRQFFEAIPNYWATTVTEPLSYHVDIPLIDILALSSRNYARITGDLPLGHGGSNTESRIFMRFDIDLIDDLMPIEYDMNDIKRAQIIGIFQEDSQSEDETDTGMIRLYPMTTDWYSELLLWEDLESGYMSTQIGSFDIAPHVIPEPGTPPDAFSGIPMPPGCPISFENTSLMANLITQWYNGSLANHGIVLIVDKVSDIPGDQRIVMQSDGFLRLTFSTQ